MSEILVSFFGLLGTIFASYYAFLGHKQAKQSGMEINQINNAVNHADENNTPRLYDMVLSNFRRVSKLEMSLDEIQRDVKDLSHVVSQHETEIDIIEDKIEGTN